MIYPQSFFLQPVRYKSLIISVNAMRALRPGDMVPPPMAQRADGLPHKNDSFTQTRLRVSTTHTDLTTSVTLNGILQQPEPAKSVSVAMETPAERVSCYFLV
jgi:hypothetical protein